MKLPVPGLFICLLSLLLIAGKMPVPTRDDLPGSEITRDEVFAGGALWGLINGGADLYYEYGFDRMALQEIKWQGEEFRLELYRMKSHGAAFGVFSVSVHGCEVGGPVSTGDCLNRFQYQLYSDNYYLSLINYSGSEKARELSVDIGAIIASATGETRVDLPGLFRQDLFKEVIDEIKVIRGILGLQNALPHLVSLYEGLDDYAVWYLKLEKMEGPAEIMLTETIDLWDDKTLDKFKLRLKEAGFTPDSNGNRILAVRSAKGREQNNDLLRLVLAGSRE
jgi:hypothetical protein